MSGDFFRFWRYIQRFSLGTILIVEILIMALGLDYFLEILNNVFNPTNNALGLLNNVAILFAVTFVFGTLGTLIGNVIIGFFSTIIALFSRKVTALRQLNPKSKWYFILFYNNNEIAFNFIKDNIDEHIEHFKLRTLGNLQPSDTLKRVELFYTSLKQYLLEIKDYNHFFMLSYQGTLTQEQRNLDNLEWDINSVRSLSLIMELGLVILYSQGLLSLFYFIILVPLLFIIFIPEFISRKRKYISYLTSVAGSIFQLGETADIADRDSI